MNHKSQKSKKYTSIVGFEISENCIVVVEIKLEKDHIAITNGFRLDIPVFKDLNNTVAVIRQSLKHSNIKSKEAAFGFSMQYFKLSPLAIPKSIPPGEIAPILLQEGNIDPSNTSAVYIPLGNTQRQDPDGVLRFDVLGISIPNQFIDFVKVLCKQCGLNPALITPSFLGLNLYLNGEPNNYLTSTLWVSQIRSEFVVWTSGDPIYEHLFLSHQLNEQIFQTVNHVQSQLAGSQISKIFTLGPYAKDLNLSQLPFNIQTFVLPNNFVDVNNIFQKISINEAVQPLALAYIASGMSDYACPNLLFPIKEGIKVKKTISKLKLLFPDSKIMDPALARFVYISSVVFLLSLFLNFFIQHFLIPKVQAKQSVLENKIVLAQTHVTKVLNYEKTNKLIGLKINFFSDLIEKRKKWSQILKEIAEVTPKGLWIDRLEIITNNVDIFGRALEVDSVANFSINLNYNTKQLSNAQIISLSKSQEEGIDIVEFQINVKFKDTSTLASTSDKLIKPTSKKNI